MNKALSRLILLSVFSLALGAPARTVYDAGKALRQNCESGSYANPYEDANGGVWSYHAFREWAGWSVEHEGEDDASLRPSADTPRKQALLDGFRKCRRRDFGAFWTSFT